MKFTLATLALVAATALASPAASNTWYDEKHNLTCDVNGDGDISCKAGHLGDAPSAASLESRDLEKRCWHGTCAAGCYGKGYCNAMCRNGKCRCSNKKEGWFCFND